MPKLHETGDDPGERRHTQG